MNSDGYILYTSLDCPACDIMIGHISQLLQETGIDITPVPVEDGQEVLDKYEDHAEAANCEGVPLLVDTKSGRSLCGAVDYQALLDWLTIK